MSITACNFLISSSFSITIPRESISFTVVLCNFSDNSLIFSVNLSKSTLALLCKSSEYSFFHYLQYDFNPDARLCVLSFIAPITNDGSIFSISS